MNQLDAYDYGERICRFRDKRSGFIWNAYRENGILPRFVVVIKSDVKPVAPPHPVSGRQLKSRVSVDLTFEAFQEYLEHAEILG